MGLSNLIANNLISKDKNKSQQAAFQIINQPDIEAWKCLTENSDYLFSFVLQKTGEKIASQIKKENIGKVFELLKYHADVLDDYIADGLAKYADDELNDEMLYLLQEGSFEEKTYAAKYIGKIRLNVAAEDLFLCVKSEFAPLKTAAAQALGLLEDKKSYEFYLNLLNSKDDWDKLEAAQFLSQYGNKDASVSILKAMSKSGMAEHLAGEAANLISINELFYAEEYEVKNLALEAFDNILSGISEVWSLAALFDFKIYDCLCSLIQLAKEDTESDFFGKYAQLLLKAKQKFSMFAENSQYTFDEEKDVINELNEINSLILSENDDFWQIQAENVVNELYMTNAKRVLSAITIISDLKIKKAKEGLTNIICNLKENELITVEAVLCLVKLGFTDEIENVECIKASIKDVNIKAILDNAL
ncbi:MAG: hypothetical protein WCK67_03450 [bacterium]